MEVSDLIFADYAAANQGNKFTLVGAGFSNIWAVRIPYVHPLMFVLARFKVTRQDIGKNRVEVRLVGEKGPLFKAGFDINVAENHQGEQHIPAPIALQNLKFDKDGAYNCEVLVNSEIKQSHVLNVIIAPQPQPQME